MKLTVEMTEEEYGEFSAFRAGKREEGRAVVELRRDLHKLADAVVGAVLLYPKQRDAEISSYEAAEKAVRLAEELGR